MDAPPEREALAPFIHVCEWLREQGFSAPAMYAKDEAQGYLLLEDLERDSFTLLCQTQRIPERELYEAAMDVLAEWHGDALRRRVGQGLKVPEYDQALLMREVKLFSDWFLPQLCDASALALLQKEYLAIWQDLLSNAKLRKDCFVHRDYHADNLFWLPNRSGVKRVGILDFQDAVLGDPAYDIVSLLEDARRDVDEKLVTHLLSRYVHSMRINHDDFMASYALLGAQRNCKIVGIFTRLAARDDKIHYLNYLPRVWRHLGHDLKHPMLEPLALWMKRHVPDSQRGIITIQRDAESLALSA
jgi:aminoglycoside/choline kinase family phosphotransferase